MTIGSLLPFDPMATSIPSVAASSASGSSARVDRDAIGSFDRHLDRALSDPDQSSTIDAAARPEVDTARQPAERVTPRHHASHVRRPAERAHPQQAATAPEGSDGPESDASLDDTTGTGERVAQTDPAVALVQAAALAATQPAATTSDAATATGEPAVDALTISAVSVTGTGSESLPGTPAAVPSAAPASTVPASTVPADETAGATAPRSGPAVADIPPPVPATPTVVELALVTTTADTAAAAPTGAPPTSAAGDAGPSDAASGDVTPTSSAAPAQGATVPGAQATDPAVVSAVAPAVAEALGEALPSNATPGPTRQADALRGPADATASPVVAAASGVSSSSTAGSSGSGDSASSPSTGRGGSSAAPTTHSAPIASMVAETGTSRLADGTAGPSADQAVVLDPRAAAMRRSGTGLPVSVPSLSMDLSDEGLGPLTLQALNGAGVVHLKLTAGDRAVGDMLSRAGGELRRDLEAGGTTVGTLDIGHSGSPSLGSGSPFASDSGPRGDAHAAPSGSGRSTATTASSGARATTPTPIHITTVNDGLDLRI